MEQPKQQQVQEDFNEEEIINALYGDIAERMKNGASNKEITAALVQKGFPHELVEQMVLNLRKEFVRIRSGQANKNVAIGALFGIGGLIATFATEGMVLFYGAIIGGFIQMIVGLTQYPKRE